MLQMIDSDRYLVNSTNQFNFVRGVIMMDGAYEQRVNSTRLRSVLGMQSNCD